MRGTGYWAPLSIPIFNFKHMKCVLTLFLLCLSIISCGQKHNAALRIPSKECIQMNDEGVKYLMKPSWEGKAVVDSAITFFRQAINCDTNYLIAYINLANAYDQKFDYKTELSVYRKLLSLSGNSAEFLVREATIYERINEIDSAKEAYLRAKAAYKQKLAVSPNDIDAIKGLIYLKALTVNKDSAITELNKQAKIHPDLSSKLNEELYFYENFDRKSIINPQAGGRR